MRAVDLRCRSTSIGDVPVLLVTGELDLSTVGVLRDAAARLVAQSPAAEVAVDLDGVTVIDDAGLGILLGAAAAARAAGGDLVVVCTDPRHLARFELSGLARAVSVRSRIAPAG